jgi:4-carboxymuconolactone decarboxylase
MGDSSKVPMVQISEEARQVVPALAEFTERVVLGNLWQRPVLTLRDRGLASMAVAVAMGSSQEQLSGQIRNALNLGLKVSEASEAILHIAFYAGWSRAILAAAALQATKTESKST